MFILFDAFTEGFQKRKFSSASQEKFTENLADEILGDSNNDKIFNPSPVMFIKNEDSNSDFDEDFKKKFEEWYTEYCTPPVENFAAESIKVVDATPSAEVVINAAIKLDTNIDANADTSDDEAIAFPPDLTDWQLRNQLMGEYYGTRAFIKKTHFEIPFKPTEDEIVLSGRDLGLKDYDIANSENFISGFTSRYQHCVNTYGKLQGDFSFEQNSVKRIKMSK